MGTTNWYDREFVEECAQLIQLEFDEEESLFHVCVDTDKLQLKFDEGRNRFFVDDERQLLGVIELDNDGTLVFCASEGACFCSELLIGLGAHLRWLNVSR